MQFNGSEFQPIGVAPQKEDALEEDDPIVQWNLIPESQEAANQEVVQHTHRANLFQRLICPWRKRRREHRRN